MSLDQMMIDRWRGCEAEVFDTWNELMPYICELHVCTSSCAYLYTLLRTINSREKMHASNLIEEIDGNEKALA